MGSQTNDSSVCYNVDTNRSIPDGFPNHLESKVVQYILLLSRHARTENNQVLVKEMS